jgi:hypothetical protein
MSLPRCLVGLVAVLGISLGSASCTLCKPIVGAVTGPAIFLGHSGGNFGCCCDGRGIAAAFLFASAVGAVAGLATGIVSDVQFLCGRAPDPCQNWADPFATNTSGPSSW